MSYSRKIEMPKTKREGLENFVQMIINKIEADESKNALLTAVDLLEDVRCGIYDEAMSDTHAHNEASGRRNCRRQRRIFARRC